MANGTLVHSDQSYSVEIEIDDTNEKLHQYYVFEM